MSSCVKIGADGAQLPPDASVWDAVLDISTGLMWSAGDVGEAMTWEAAEIACAKLSLAGASDWRMPTVEELFALADHGRISPAIDTDFFPTTKSDWYWASTKHAPSSGYAWIVGFSSGSARHYHQLNECLVRAVRRAMPTNQ